MVLNVQLLCLIFAGLLVNVENKKYDVEAEAQKLYGQNLALVLSRFRKTADYLKILNEKAQDLQTEATEVFGQIWEYYQTQMNEQIADMVGMNTLSTTEAPTSPGRNMMRQRAARRQDMTEIDAEKQKRVNRIDNYKLLSNTLSLKERNEFKDLGFKYIGDAIHMGIEKMGVEGDDGDSKSTQMPSGGNALRMRTTTEHARDHRVTKEPTTEAPGIDTD